MADRPSKSDTVAFRHVNEDEPASADVKKCSIGCDTEVRCTSVALHRSQPDDGPPSLFEAGGPASTRLRSDPSHKLSTDRNSASFETEW